MAGIYAYKPWGTKGVVHGHRLQNIEESFKSGMMYTNAPLNDGYIRTLVNYDLKDSGEIICPRPGLRTERAFLPTDTDSTCTGTEQLFAAKAQFIDHQTRPQLFMKKTLATGTGILRDGSILCATGIGEDMASGGVEGVATQGFNEISYSHANFIVPEAAEIHKIKLQNTETLARQVGTFAWNSNYYFLDSANKKVVYTEYNSATSKYAFKTKDPRGMNPKSAVTYGYNMLAENPYLFANEETAAGTKIVFTGMLPYDSNNQLCMTPVVNQDLTFKMFYTAAKQDEQYKIVIEWRASATNSWEILKSDTVTFATNSALPNVEIKFSPPAQSLTLRVTAYLVTGETPAVTAEAQLAVGFNFNKEAYGSTANVENKNYDLFSTTGMTYWKNRLLVWGAPEDRNILFASDVNDPSFFPYPNSVDSFDEPIKYAVPYMDYLLVFTSSKLYMLTMNTDGATWTQTLLQNNLTIADWDIHLIQVVKNMVFFRSGNYYYMVVPKSGTTTGALTIAAITKPMYAFFDHFAENITAVLQDMYGYTGTLDLIHYYNYLDFEDVHNCYVFKTDTTEYINFCMLYSTTDRSWRAYVLGSQSVLYPFRQDATQKGAVCAMGSTTDYGIPQLLTYDPNNLGDFYVPKNCTLSTAQASFAAAHAFKNWQYLDTGYREQNSNFKKRFREIQFVLNNTSNKALKFHTEFYIDGEQRTSRYEYRVTQNADPESSDYGELQIERILKEGITAPGTTILGTAATDTIAWQLDVSTLPDVSFWKARCPISGKGYAPRLLLIAENEETYELLNISWVYRALYSR